MLNKLLAGITTLILLGSALFLLLYGSELVWLGGSPYYVVAGLVLLATAILLFRRRGLALLLYGAFLVGTLGWAVWEAGLDGWALVPRILAPVVLGLWLLCPLSSFDKRSKAGSGWKTFSLSSLAFLVCVALVFLAAMERTETPGALISPDALASGAISETAWLHYGNDQGGTRFSPLRQITPANVAQLKPLWTYRTGHDQKTSAPFEANPLQVGNSLYLCTPYNDVISLDGETGRENWRYDANTDTKGVLIANCRGVAYYVSPGQDPNSFCASRIYTATIDARLIALDARSGRPCPDFGKNGAVDLKQGMGLVDPGFYYISSAPQLVRGKLVIGGWVRDNVGTDEPSGVIRAFDAITGKMAWAFDMGRPDRTGMPAQGESFTRSTPNSWAPMSADENLGLVYVPTGNATPDWYGGKRRPFDDRYSSSVVAIDAESGKVRWSFQTTHHDLWDYDVPAQATLYDMPMGAKTVPALLQPTKLGELFVLDRRTGKPLFNVVERPVPQGNVPGERYSPTQPFQQDFPSFRGPRYTEQMMWGSTPLDQLWCRLAFRKARYDGHFTPAGLDKPSLIFPGFMGGMEWGGVAIDKTRNIAIVNTQYMGMVARLIPRKNVDEKAILNGDSYDETGVHLQKGTPYLLKLLPFLSPLKIPCNKPPYGRISAIDLKTRSLLWERPFGVASETGPFGIPSNLPLTIGAPNMGGAVVTSSGLTFIAATQDRYFRAYETATGKLLWRVQLPAGGQSTPMTYISPKSGRQIIVTTAGGNGPLTAKAGDYVMAFGL